MITALDHIAIAVPNLEQSIKRFMDDFGLDFQGQEDVTDAKTSTAFFPVPATSIELVHPLNGEGPIANYLDKRQLHIAQTMYEEKRLPNMAVLLNGTSIKRGYGYGYGTGPKKKKWYKLSTK